MTQTPAKPRIVITKDGGLIEDVFSDTPIEIRIIDYDVDWTAEENPDDPDEAQHITMKHADGHTETAYVVHRETADVNPEIVNKIFQKTAHIFET